MNPYLLFCFVAWLAYIHRNQRGNGLGHTGEDI